MGDGRRILLLDDDEDVRDALGDLIRLYGAECVSLPSVSAMEAAQAEVLACGLAILDVNLGDGQPSGVDAFDWLHKHSFTGQVVFLTGHGSAHPAMTRAYGHGVRVMTKPIETDDLRALVASV